MTETETLRAAATRLRTLAEGADGGMYARLYVDGDTLWRANDPEGHSADGLTGPWAIHAHGMLRLVSALGPDLARLLADWLDVEATEAIRLPGGVEIVAAPASAVARHIIREA